MREKSYVRMDGCHVSPCGAGCAKSRSCGGYEDGALTSSSKDNGYAIRGNARYVKRSRGPSSVRADYGGNQLHDGRERR